MASTNPLPHAELLPADGLASSRPRGARKRGAAAKAPRVRRLTRGKLRNLRNQAGKTFTIAGWPAFDTLKPVLGFLAIPGALILAITITGGHWPTAILYSIALALGFIVAASTFRGVELVLAVLLIYLPFSKLFVIPIAPGVNGTNMLLILGLFASVLRLLATRQKLTEFPAGSYLVFAFGFLTALSAFTIMLQPGGRTFLLYSEFLSYKAWLDQFLFYFIVLMCVRDVETAKRCVVYVLIGSVLVVLYSVPEMLEKSGRSTIEKSRIGGPHLQSNNFGGFVAYTVLPLIALFLVYIKDIRAWLLTPYFLLTAKVLITTFSRGAYVAIFIGGLLAGWLKGKRFVALWVAFMLMLVVIFPGVIPGSIVERMNAFTEDQNSAAPVEEKLDQSSATRLIMWRAAVLMIEEDPIWGKGFKGFQFLKDDYVDIDVEESDPHNMYLYIGSQMGLPSLSLFLVILGYSFWLGIQLSKDRQDRFIRVIGIGGAAATACFAIVCVFGSRAVSLNFTVYFWTLTVVMQVIRQKQLEAEAALHPRRIRTFAIDVTRQAAAERAALSEDNNAQKSLSDVTPCNDHNAQQHSFQKTSEWQSSKSCHSKRSPKRGAAAHQARQQTECPDPPRQEIFDNRQSRAWSSSEQKQLPAVQRGPATDNAHANDSVLNHSQDSRLRRKLSRMKRKPSAARKQTVTSVT